MFRQSQPQQIKELEITVVGNKVYFTIPKEDAPIRVGLKKAPEPSENEKRDKQIEIINGATWTKIVDGYDFLRPWQEFADTLRHWDYPHLTEGKFWAFTIDKYDFFFQNGTNETSLETSNANISFYMDFRVGHGFRRASNGNEIDISFNKTFRLHALRTTKKDEKESDVEEFEVEVTELGNRKTITKKKMAVAGGAAGGGALLLLLIILFFIFSSSGNGDQ